MSWKSENAVVTNVGLQLLAKANAGLGKMQVTKVVTTDTDSTASANRELSGTSATIPYNQECTMLNVYGGKIISSSEQGGESELQVKVTNSDVSSSGPVYPYQIKQVIVFMRLVKPNGTYEDELPYMVAQADGTPDSMPDFSENPVTLNYSLHILHTGVAQVIVEENLADYVTVEQLNTAIGVVGDEVDALESAINNKVDKIAGKGLSTNDFTNAYKSKLDNLNDNLASKVDKVSGKGLSTNDYTTSEKQKLAGLSNYDDTALQTAVASLTDSVDCLKSMVYPHIIIKGGSSEYTLSKGSRVIQGHLDADLTADVPVPETGIWALNNGGDTKYYFVSAPMTRNSEALVVSPTLSENTPYMIQKVAKTGLASSFWSVGDYTSAITLSGTVGVTSLNHQFYAFIIGFDHNEGIEGSNSIHFGLGAVNTGGSNMVHTAIIDVMYNSTTYTSEGYFNMETSDSNSGGWRESQMRKNIMPALKWAMPMIWQSVIKPTTKYTYDGIQVNPTEDELFLLSECEITGRSQYGYGDEADYQEQYSYFKSGSKKLYKHSNIYTACNWWTRSVSDTSYPSRNFVYINDSGSASTTYGTKALGVFYGFKVA